MLLVMLEFAKFQPSISVIASSTTVLFLGFLAIQAFFNIIKNRISKKEKLKLDLVNLTSYVAMVLFSSIQIARIIEALFGLSAISKFLGTLLIYIGTPILMVPFVGHFAHEIIQELRRRRNPQVPDGGTKASESHPLPRQSYRYRNIFLGVNIAVVIIFTSITVSFLISPWYYVAISNLSLNITSDVLVPNKAKEDQNIHLNDTGNNGTIPKGDPYPNFI